MDEIAELKLLSGISNRPKWQEYKGYPGSNISVTGTEKAKLMREHNIKPGTEAWFKLWFAKTEITGEIPF
jgi:hypothetical protein